MHAPSLHGEYMVATNPPAALEKLLATAVAAKSVDVLDGVNADCPGEARPSLTSGTPPTIVVATSPTELVVSDGPEQWAVLHGKKLLHLKNTTGHVFKHLDDNHTYVLSAGRWLRTQGGASDWSFVESSKLPADFLAIPDDSPKENVKASIEDTVQSAEALIANEILQTAIIDRKKASYKSRFDGEPRFASVEGTTLRYITNSPDPVIEVQPGSYFAVNNGVWFASTRPKGPWSVAASIPAAIYSIPPPLYSTSPSSASIVLRQNRSGWATPLATLEHSATATSSSSGPAGTTLPGSVPFGMAIPPPMASAAGSLIRLGEAGTSRLASAGTGVGLRSASAGVGGTAPGGYWRYQYP